MRSDIESKCGAHCGPGRSSGTCRHQSSWWIFWLKIKTPVTVGTIILETRRVMFLIFKTNQEKLAFSGSLLPSVVPRLLGYGLPRCLQNPRKTLQTTLLSFETTRQKQELRIWLWLGLFGAKKVWTEDLPPLLWRWKISSRPTTWRTGLCSSIWDIFRLPEEMQTVLLIFICSSSLF